jgi:hypothetical protein
VFCNRPHKKRRHAVPDPRSLLGELAFQFELLGEGRHQFDLTYRQVPDLVWVDQARCAAFRLRLLDRRAGFVGVEVDQAEVLLGFLARQHPEGLTVRSDLSLLEFIARIGFTDRRRGLVGQNPGIYPLRPGAERSRNDGLDRDRLVIRIGMESRAIL